jgi:microcystin-dependent protein
MSTGYQINFTDSVNKGFIQVDDNSVNNETSLSFPGRTKSDYGKLILENLLHLMENFANNNPPTNPVEGQLWYDTTIGVDQLKVYDGAQWVSAGSIKKANSRPEAVESNLGDLWVDTANQQLFLYNGNDWTLVGPEFSLGSNTGAKFEEIVDTTNVKQSVVINFVKGVPVAIISDTEFIPKAAISLGFPQGTIIKPGINLALNLKYYGTAEAAESIIVSTSEPPVLGANFARRDRDNTFARPIRVQNNSGINIGETPTLQMSISASNSIIRNLATNGDIQFRLTEGTRSNTVLKLTSNGRVGINTKDEPTEALDVAGNIKTSGSLKVNDILEVIGTSTFKNNLTVEGNTDLSNLTAWNITPDQTGRNIGTSSLRFNNIFAETVNSNAFRGNVFTGPGGDPALFVGTLDGAATSLTSPTTFQLAGEVFSTNQITYGNSGNVGGTRTFNTEISPTFITNKPTTTTINQDDEILIIRDNNGTDEIRRVTQEVLVSSVPAIPIGMITPYAGDTLPVDPDGKTRWLFCDGTIVLRSSFGALFSVIGTKFNGTDVSVSSLHFRLPDFRGRFPLGSANMQNSFGPSTPSIPTDKDLSSIVTDQNAEVVGQKDGSANKIIEVENLPEHIHTLSGENTDFYAISNIPNAPDSGVDSLAADISGDLQSSNIAQTGGVIGNNGEEFSVVNPYQTVNYIIYAGATI